MNGGFEDEGTLLKGAHYDATDTTGNAISEDERRVMNVAEAAFDAKGRLKPVAGTLGKFQMFYWPPAVGADRKSGQWGQVFPALITEVGPPVKVGAVKLADWATVDATLKSDVVVVLPAGATPSLSMPGVVVQGSDLGSKQLLFVPVGGGGAGASVSPAKIRLQISPSYYQVDLYDNDYSSAATATALTAEVIDLNSVAWSGGERVTVFKDGASYYIASIKPWIPNTLPPIWDARVTVNNGDGTYFVKATLGPGLGFKPGAVDTLVTEYTHSTLVLVGMDLPVFSVGVPTQYRIWCPLGDCS